MQAAQFWNKIAERYAKSPIDDLEAYEATLERTQAHLAASDVALELGCGTGSTAVRLASSVERYTASDFSSSMVEIARRRAEEARVSNLDFAVCQLQDRALAASSYDVILSFNVLHLVRELPSALSHIHGLLRPGGRFISKTPCWPDRSVPLKYRALTLMLPVMRLVGKAPEYVSLPTVRDLEALMRSAGFEIAETGDYPSHPPSHFIVARKPLSH